MLVFKTLNPGGWWGKARWAKSGDDPKKKDGLHGIHAPFMHQGISGTTPIPASEASSCMRTQTECLFRGCNTRGGYRSLLFDTESGALRQTGPRGRTYLHLRKSSRPCAGGLICNSISHNVISLAFTHLADADNQARRIMKYRTHRRPSDLSHLAFSPSLTRTHDRKWMTFLLNIY